MPVNTLKLNPSEKETLELRRLCDGAALFGDAVKRVMREKGVNEGRAIRMARSVRGDLYNTWCERGRPNFL